MTIAIDDISTTEQLDREALTKVRGGVAQISTPAPGIPAFLNFPPSRTAFHSMAAAHYPRPPHEIITTDPKNPLLQ